MIVLLLALGLGAAARGFRPPMPGRIHIGALASLLILTIACAILLLGVRRIALRRAAAVYAIEGTSLWICFGLGWFSVGQQLSSELFLIPLFGCVATVLPGVFLLGVIQDFRPPLRLMCCPGCEYDLRGLTTTTPCPECGDAFAATCAMCGTALIDLAETACSECKTVFAPGTVLIDPDPATDEPVTTS